MRIAILGCGKIGSTVAADLSHDHDVKVIDTDQSRFTALPYNGITCVAAHITPASIPDLIAGADVVVNAVPGYVGFDILEAVVAHSVDVVDVSFAEQDQFTLKSRAERSGSIAIVDAGVAPGLWNLILGECETSMFKVESCTCYVGGLPVQRTLPWQYKAGYSLYDVFEMYTRDCRYLQAGHVVTSPAMSEIFDIEFPGVGTLEAFNTDGLRSLLTTSTTPTVKEYTLRYPGHLAHMKLLRDSGMLDNAPVGVRDHVTGITTNVRPIDVTASQLLKQWTFDRNEEDMTLMRIEVVGYESYHAGRTKRVYMLHDRARDGVSSMSRTTSYTCTGVINALINNRKSLVGGVYALEQMAKCGTFCNEVLEHLAARDVKFTLNIQAA